MGYDKNGVLCPAVNTSAVIVLAAIVRLMWRHKYELAAADDVELSWVERL